MQPSLKLTSLGPRFYLILLIAQVMLVLGVKLIQPQIETHSILLFLLFYARWAKH